MKMLYLMRHGETLFNVMDVNQGQCDSPLTENGIRQAQAAKAWFDAHHVHFDAVYSSTAERACDTAEIVSGGMPYTRRKDLKEIFLGTKEASPNAENPAYPYGNYFVPYGGEDLDAFTQRIYRAVLDVAAHAEGSTVLIVSHGMAIRRFLTVLAPASPTAQNGIANCGIVHLTYEDGVLMLQQVIDPNASVFPISLPTISKEVFVMNNIIQAMETRRSIRKFKPDTPRKEDLDQIIEAGLYAANGKGRQGAIILAVTNKELRDKLSALNHEIGGFPEGVDPFYGAPAVLIVLADKSCFTGIYDGSLVMGNLMLAAHSLGLGSIWIHRAKEEFERAEYKQLLKELGVEGEWEGIGHCVVGYIDGEAPQPAPRKENRVFWVE